MPYDVTVLKTRAQCLEAKASLVAELDTYQNRDQNLAFQDRQEDRSTAKVASRLATATANVTYLTGQLARPDLSDGDRRRYEDQLLTASYQKARLQNRTAADEGAATFLADVNDDQLDAQVAVLSGAIAAVQTHHDGLSA